MAALSPLALESVRKLAVSVVIFFAAAGCVVVAARRVGASARVRSVISTLEGGGSASALERLVVFVTHGEVAARHPKEFRGVRSPTAADFLGCLGGLVSCFLVWGVLQERMMTRSYDGDVFETSSVLVFANKFFGALAALVLWAPWRRARAPT